MAISVQIAREKLSVLIGPAERLDRAVVLGEDDALKLILVAAGRGGRRVGRIIAGNGGSSLGAPMMGELSSVEAEPPDWELPAEASAETSPLLPPQWLRPEQHKGDEQEQSELFHSLRTDYAPALAAARPFFEICVYSSAVGQRIGNLAGRR
ncbi:MAG: hypothetical protein ACLUFV_03010 [Acutalibacteraceae bacterium]